MIEIRSFSAKIIMALVSRVQFLLLVLVVCTALLHRERVLANRSVQDQYTYWSDPRVDIPRLFSLDRQRNVIVLAARDSICHLSMDLSQASNLQNVSPSDTNVTHCKNVEFRSDDECFNTYHILQFPTINATMNISGQAVPFTETVLTCGTNAFNPNCQYRNRTTLELLSSFPGINFCPYTPHSQTASLLSSDGRLLAGTSLDRLVSEYGITKSQDPFMGSLSVETRRDNLWLQTPGSFVDMYEREDYFYIFMREKASESSTDSSSQVIYSRVARICKNDTGKVDPAETNSVPVFTTYLKARMACKAASVSTIDYYYNDLEDTCYSSSNTTVSPVAEEHLYGVFRSPDNSPVGSALCVYTFGSNHNDLERVFQGQYQKQSGLGQFSPAPNNDYPNLCQNGRSYSEASTTVLMNEVAVQPQSQPLLTMDGFLFHRIVVDHVPALDGMIYEVLFILATTSELEPHLFKVTHVPGRGGNTLEDNTHISQSIRLLRDGRREGVGQAPGTMELFRSDNNEVLIYISTDEGVYRVPAHNCHNYTNCNDCVAARDPYCAFDTVNQSCVSSSSLSTSLVQDVVNGSTAICAIDPVTPSPSSVVSAATTASLTNDRSTQPGGRIEQSTTTTNTRPTIVPPSGSIAPSTTSPDFIWPIVAGVGGLVVGIFFGIVLFALIRNRHNFIWSPRNRRGNYAVSYENDKVPRSNGTAEKAESWLNNSEYSKPANRPSTPPLTKLNPTSTPSLHRVTDSPVLTKYQHDRGHSRSQSSGGLNPFTTYNNHADPNLKTTVLVEEKITNRDRERFGHNMVSRQISKEYPMQTTPRYTTVEYHVRSGSLDIDRNNYPN